MKLPDPKMMVSRARSYIKGIDNMVQAKITTDLLPTMDQLVSLSIGGEEDLTYLLVPATCAECMIMYKTGVLIEEDTEKGFNSAYEKAKSMGPVVIELACPGISRTIMRTVSEMIYDDYNMEKAVKLGRTLYQGQDLETIKTRARVVNLTSNCTILSLIFFSFGYIHRGYMTNQLQVDADQTAYNDRIPESIFQEYLAKKELESQSKDSGLTGLGMDLYYNSGYNIHDHAKRTNDNKGRKGRKDRKGRRSGDNKKNQGNQKGQRNQKDQKDQKDRKGKNVVGKGRKRYKKND